MRRGEGKPIVGADGPRQAAFLEQALKPLHHVRDERMPQVMEPEPRETSLFGQSVPRCVPVHLVLIGVISALALMLPVGNAGQVLGHQVVLRPTGWWLQRPSRH
jgi:hypothetical protein